MTTFFGSNPGSVNSFNFSGVNSFNQNATSDGYSITAPGRVVDLSTYWDGDGVSVTGKNVIWKHSDSSIELQSSSYSSNSGTHNVNGQSLHTTSVDYFFNTTHSVDIGFWRDKTASDVFTVDTVDGPADFGQTKTSTSNAVDDFTSQTSFATAYGANATMTAYGHYAPSTIYVRRAGVWTAIPAYVRRSGSWTQVKVYVRRSGAWTLLNSIKPNEWDDLKEREAIIVYPDNSWEEAIIREEGLVRFGTFNPMLDPRLDGSIKVIKPDWYDKMWETQESGILVRK